MKWILAKIAIHKIDKMIIKKPFWENLIIYSTTRKRHAIHMNLLFQLIDTNID